MKIGVVRILAGVSFVMTLAGSTILGTKVVAAHPTTGMGFFQNALQTESKQTMPHTVSTLLTRNLQDVFGENDPARRRAAIDEIYTEDGVFYEPSKNVYRGRDEIDRIAGALLPRFASCFSTFVPYVLRIVDARSSSLGFSKGDTLCTTCPSRWIVMGVTDFL